MIRPYIGTSNRCGLQTLQPENECTARALAGLVGRLRRPLSACWWVNLHDSTAIEVLNHIARGDRLAALLTINREAPHSGPIFPQKH
jgi:hypothetical protein